MKKAMFILIMVGFLCPAAGYSQTDSLRIMEKLNQLEQVTSETKALLQKADKLEKRKQTLIQRLKAYVNHLKKDLNDKQLIESKLQYKAIKENNINQPVQEVVIPYGVDTIRRGFLYRIFHPNSIILRPYKIVNDEKIYLD